MFRILDRQIPLCRQRLWHITRRPLTSSRLEPFTRWMIQYQTGDGMMCTVPKAHHPDWTNMVLSVEWIKPRRWIFKRGNNDICGTRKSDGCWCWNTTTEKVPDASRHQSWSTLKLHNIYSGSSYTTNTGSSYCTLILYATMNKDPHSPCFNNNDLATLCLLSVAFKGRLNIRILIPMFSGTKTHEHRYS